MCSSDAVDVTWVANHYEMSPAPLQLQICFDPSLGGFGYLRPRMSRLCSSHVAGPSSCLKHSVPNLCAGTCSALGAVYQCAAP